MGVLAGNEVGGKTEVDFLSIGNQELTKPTGRAGTNTAFFAKQLNADPNQIPSTFRSTGFSEAGWTVGQSCTHSVTF